MGCGLLFLFTFGLLVVCGFSAMGIIFAAGAIAQNGSNSADALAGIGFLLVLGTLFFIGHLWYLYFVQDGVPFQWRYLLPPGFMLLYVVGMGLSLGG